MSDTQPGTLAVLGARGPFPSVPLRDPLERRWLHYAFVSRMPGVSMIANLSTLGPPPEDPGSEPQHMAILLVHDAKHGWSSSQFNAVQQGVPWSAFRLPRAFDAPEPFALKAQSGTPAVDLQLRRTSRPCTSQCAPFGRDQHLRWQSEPGVSATGTVIVGDDEQAVDLIGYHERVRGLWGWPELGGWIFGFAIDSTAGPSEAPPAAVVFTFIQPPSPADATTGSVMLWRDGRLQRHFPRRTLEVAVRGEMLRDAVVVTPPLAATLGTAPTAPVPSRLVITARSGDDWLVLDFGSETAARIVNASETSFYPFSVHEVLGDCRIEGFVSGQRVLIETQGVVEFAGGARDI